MVFRVRKRFRVRNEGSGALHAVARCEEPWALVRGAEAEAEGEGPPRTRLQLVEIHLQPWSSLEVTELTARCRSLSS